MTANGPPTEQTGRARPLDGKAESKGVARGLAESHGAVLMVIAAGAAFYFGALTIYRIGFGDRQAYAFLNLLSIFAAAYCTVGFFWLRSAKPPLVALEGFSAVLFTLLYANISLESAVFTGAHIENYYILLILGIAAAGVTMRVVVPFVALTASTLLVVGSHHHAEQLFAQGIITLASIAASITIALVIQKTLRREVTARVGERRLRLMAEDAAERDELTGIANRRGFMRALASAIEDNPGRPIAVACIDLDGFKSVNDLYGHATGDRLLQLVSERIGKPCPKSPACFAARMGGDEFALFMVNPPSGDFLVKLMQGLSDRLREPYRVDDISLWSSASIGIARYPEDASEPTRLLECADFALYKVKQSGKDGVRGFTSAFDREMKAARAVEYALQNCNFKEELALEYQPQVDLTEGRIVGFEALARWNSPILGEVAPGAFIASAERIGLMHEITSTLLRRALADAKCWPDGVTLSFNLSVRDITKPGAVEAVAQIVRNAEFPAERLIFEITETALMQDFETAIASIRQLSRLGARIALDDFGAGYSSFGQLDRLPIDILKLDRALLARIGASDRSRRIFRSVLDLAQGLDLGCVVEGVESADQLEIVSSLGTHLVQGFHIGRPAPPDVAAALVQAERDSVPAALSA